MDLGLYGSRALITRGSRGIGLAVADALAAEGAVVGLIARDANGLVAAVQHWARRAHLATEVADVTNTGALNCAVDEIAAALGVLDDHLVANAGGTVGGGNLANSDVGDPPRLSL
jgi:3-oxoacyl-[acyl-carrier protein] reductase